MRTITLRLPNEVHQTIKMLAIERNVSMSKLYEDISGVIVRSHVAEARFLDRVAKGSQEKGLAILDTLDQYYMESRQ